MARRLNLSTPDVGTPDADRPGGFFLDESVSDPGTPILADNKNDIYYFFERLMEEAGESFNNVVDNITASQFWTAFNKAKSKLESETVAVSSTISPVASRVFEIDTSGGNVSINVSDGVEVGQTVFIYNSGAGETDISGTGIVSNTRIGDEGVTLIWLGSFWSVVFHSPKIGATYIQFPGDDDPASLGYHGTWSNVSSELAGDFIRFEGTAGNGGSAAAFESGEVNDAMQKITGLISTNLGEFAAGGSKSGVFSGSPISSSGGRGGGGGGFAWESINFDSSSSSSPNPSKTDDVESYPVYKTVRKWRRTA